MPTAVLSLVSRSRRTYPRCEVLPVEKALTTGDVGSCNLYMTYCSGNPLVHQKFCVYCPHGEESLIARSVNLVGSHLHQFSKWVIFSFSTLGYNARMFGLSSPIILFVSSSQVIAVAIPLICSAAKRALVKAEETQFYR